MKRIVYPGSFDPITPGHLDIIKRISQIFKQATDEIIVLVTNSHTKTGLFSLTERIQLIEQCQVDRVKVDSWQGLTVDYLKQSKANILIRGLRAVGDFDYELTMAHLNRKLDPDIETLLIFASPEYSFVSSRGAKEIASYKSESSNSESSKSEFKSESSNKLFGLVPPHVVEPLKNKFMK